MSQSTSCVCLYTYVFLHVYVRACTCVPKSCVHVLCSFVFLHVFMCILVCPHMSTCLAVPACFRVYDHLCVLHAFCMFVYVCPYVSAHIHVCACMYLLCVHVCICMQKQVWLYPQLNYLWNWVLEDTPPGLAPDGTW